MRNLKVWGVVPHEDSEFFLSHTSDKMKKHLSPFLYRAQNLPSPLFLCTNIMLMDIANPSSMQDTCHMNFLIDFAHNVVSCGSFVEHRSTESEGLRFNSSWGLGIFSLSHACDKTEKHLSLFFYQAQSLPSLLFLSTNLRLWTLLILAVCRMHVI